MAHLFGTLCFAAVLVVPTFSQSIAQEWSVEALDTDSEDSSGPGYCLLRSSEGLVLTLSRYTNANYVGFNSWSEKIGQPWRPIGAVQGLTAILQVDDGAPILRDASIHHVPRPESGGVLIDGYIYPTDSTFIDSLRSGSQLFIRLGENLEFSMDVQSGSDTTLTYSLNGSSAAISELEQCVATPYPNFRRAASQAEIASPEATLASEADCDFHEGIWRSGTSDDSRIFYMDDEGTTSRHNVFFERWIDGKLVARMYGNLASSMGVPVMGVSILKEHYFFNEDPDGELIEHNGRVAGVTVEPLFKSGRDIPDMLIFSSLHQQLWNAGSDHVDFYGEVEDPDHVFAGPNGFTFLSCRTERAVLDPPPK